MTKKQNNALLEGLNREQVEAVTHEAGPLLIVAGAGTGKTTVITRKIGYLIEQGVQSNSILALTYMNKAAQEIAERVDQLLPYGYLDINIATFHSFGEQILRDYGLEIGLPSNFKVLSETDQWLLIRENFDKFELDYYKPLGNPTKFIQAMVKFFSRCKDEEILPADLHKYAEDRRLNLDSPEFVGTRDEEELEVRKYLELAGAYARYEKLLYENSALDFGDSIIQAIRLFRERPNILKKYRERYKYILVDEFQDTNYALYQLIKMIAEPENNLTVVGDDDQSIFKFRGASYSNILKFMEDFPSTKRIFLIQNYRSRQNLLDAAYKFIQANNPGRLEVQLNKGKGKKISKELKAAQKGTGILEQHVLPNADAEAAAVVAKIITLKNEDLELTLNDFAIMARSNDALNPFIAELERHQISYIYYANKGLYRKPIIADLLAYFKLLDNYHETQALYRAARFPIFAVADITLVEAGQLARRKSISYYEALKNFQDDSGIKKLMSVLSAHTQLARDKSCEVVISQILSDLNFLKIAASDRQSAQHLSALEKKMKAFLSDTRDRSLKAFLQRIEQEIESGEQGQLEVDLEAGPEAVKVMTVHGAKGLEFPYVFIVGLVDKRFPTTERHEEIEVPKELVRDIVPEGDIHLAEERRLFYVGLTRAKNGLFLTRALDYGGKLTKKPSRFLIEMGLAQEEKSKPSGAVVFTPKKNASALPLPEKFSFTHISDFRSCPLEYKYKHILKLPTEGSHHRSFGDTMHRTFESFLRLWQVGLQSTDLFGKKADNGLPGLETLLKIYQESFIDDWFESPEQLTEYRELGKKMAKVFYEECQKHKPDPKYIETRFTMKLDKFEFTGKIDRADIVPGGLNVIDYKTGEPKHDLQKVDKEQLLIYQWAAQEFFKETVKNLEYWYFKDGLSKVPFLGSAEEIEKMRAGLLETIIKISDCTRNDSFLEADLDTSHRNPCVWRELEKNGASLPS